MKKLVKSNKVSVNNANLYAGEYFEVYCVSGKLDHYCQYQENPKLKSDRVWGKIYTEASGYCPKCRKSTHNCVMTSNYDSVNNIKNHNHHNAKFVYR